MEKLYYLVISNKKIIGVFYGKKALSDALNFMYMPGFQARGGSYDAAIKTATEFNAHKRIFDEIDQLAGKKPKIKESKQMTLPGL